MSEKLFVNTEYDCNNLSKMRLQSPEELKVVIWDKELCNDAEWNDFLECVEEKSKENAELKKQLAITEKALELACDKLSCKDCPHSDGVSYCYKAEDSYPPETEECINYIASYFKTKAKEMLKNE